MVRHAPLTRTIPIALALVTLSAVSVSAQATAPSAAQAAPVRVRGTSTEAFSGATLTLEEALSLARRRNPDFLQQANDEVEADWLVREAYGQLLPGASVQTAFQYQAPGTPNFGIFSGQELGISKTSSIYYSSYQLGLSYRLSGQQLFAPTQQRAARRATVAKIDAAAAQLEADVKRQYLAVKRAEDARVLAEQELERAKETAKLAEAKVAVGSAIALEAKQAQVEAGRAEVALLQAEQQLVTERLRLSERLGVELPADVVLTSEFAIAPLSLSAEELIARALGSQPQLVSAKASAASAAAGVRAARTQYLPSLSFQVGWSGSARESGSEGYVIQQAKDQLSGQKTSCELLNNISAGLTSPLPGTPGDCSKFDWTADKERAVVAGNNVFPFNYTAQPMYAQVTVSLPLFSGFSRERQLESARVAEQDARERVRAQELSLRTGVQAGVAAIETARRTVELEKRNRELATEQLGMERERYRVGASSFLQLQEAETIKARADRSYLASLYGYHEAMATLEATVGGPLQ